ncbi:MAG: ABC transporter permease [Gemmatimonadota bacterium]|nr:ABC transporter permease [Gemmatimonadota bacterium]
MIRRVAAAIEARWRALRGGRFEADMDEEIRFHLEHATQRNIERGMDPDGARRAAVREFGGFDSVEGTKEDVRGQTGVRFFVDARRDLRHAVRAARRSPGFTVVAIVTLALGIGANTAVFSAIDSVLLSPLPYDDSDRLVRLFSVWEGDPEGRGVLSALDFVDFREQVDAFETLAGVYTYEEQGVDLMGPDGPVRLRALPIGAGYFETYRATPLLGRTFERAEERGDALVTILSHRAWRDLTDSDPGAIGGSLTLDGRPFTIVGVMRPTFTDVVAGDVDLWIPQNLQEGGFNSRANMYLAAIGRLEPRVDIAQAQAEIDLVTARLHEEFPEEAWRTTRVVSMHEDVVRGSSTMLYVLLGASGLVLLIACVNLANLALARGTARQGELAVRLALGSGRGRLVRQLSTEALVLAAMGGAVGLAVASLGLRALIATGPESLPRAEEIGFDGSLLLFGLVVSALTALAFGVAPALGLTRGLSGSMGQEARGLDGGRGRARLRSALVGAQIALAVMLLFGAGVLMRGFVELQRLDPGFDPTAVTTFEVNLPETRYADAVSRIAFHREFHDRLEALPGVQAVGATQWLPLAGAGYQWGLRWDGEGGDTGFSVQVRIVEGDYLGALGVPVVEGRTFGPDETPDSEPVILLSESAARQAFGDAALNRLVRVGGREARVVGIVGDVAHASTGESGPTAYLPHIQFADRSWDLTVVASTASGPAAFLSGARSELASMDGQLVLYRPRTMEDIAATQIARERFAFTLMGVFAVVALALAAIGLYGVLSYVVSQRVREMGVRMALGARSSQILRLVAGRGAFVVAVGIVVGFIGALAFARTLASITFDVDVTHWPTFFGVVVVIGAASALAVALPARRATRVDPMEALRLE